VHRLARSIGPDVMEIPSPRHSIINRLGPRLFAPAAVAIIVFSAAFGTLPSASAANASTQPLSPSSVVANDVASSGFLIGPDVSGWQHTGGNIDWAAVAASGVSFTFVKATEGLNGGTIPYTNPNFARDFAGAGNNGLYRGAYHFARPALPLSTAVDQARHFVSVTGAMNNALDLPPVLDLEVTGDLAPTDLIAWTTTWLTAVQNLTGRQPMIYSGPSFWYSAMANTTALNTYPLWIARWNNNPDPLPLPGGWTAWSFWQYTSTGAIPGIVGNVDISRYCCSLARLAALSGSPSGRPHIYLRNSTTTGVANTDYVFSASAGGTLLMCDWNGDGTDTPGVFVNGTWYLTNSTTGGIPEIDFAFGDPGDIPVCGDWNGTGSDRPGVVRRGAALTWFLSNTLGSGFADRSFSYGDRFDAPLVGDWNGDGTDTPAVKRGAMWYLSNTSGVPRADQSFAYGNPSDIGVIGEWTRTGHDSVGVKRGAVWYLTNTLGAPFADITMTYGEPSDIPLTGRWRAGATSSVGISRPTL